MRPGHSAGDILFCDAQFSQPPPHLAGANKDTSIQEIFISFKDTRSFAAEKWLLSLILYLLCAYLFEIKGLVAPTGIEPVLSALKGPRVNQLHHGAKHKQHPSASTICCLLHKKRKKKQDLVALPGLEPGLSALRGRRVNQLHHNAKSQSAQKETLSRPLVEV